MQNHKTFLQSFLSSCAIISCSFFFFLLQINSRERLETPQLTMRGGKKNSSSWLEFNKSTSPSGLGLCTWFTGPGTGAIDRGNHSRLAQGWKTREREGERALKLHQTQHNKSKGDYCNCVRYFSDQLLGLTGTAPRGAWVPSPQQVQHSIMWRLPRPHACICRKKRVAIGETPWRTNLLNVRRQNQVTTLVSGGSQNISRGSGELQQT